MNGLITTNLQENEIVKASDLQLGGDNGIENLEKFFAALSLAKKNVVIGGKLTAYQTGTGLAAKMEPVIGYNYTTKKMFADHEGKVYMEGDETSSDYITFMAADSSRRRDIVEVKADVITSGEQTRQFYNPETEATSYAVTNIEKIQILRCKVKKGTPGSDTAPTTDNGYVKIAEVVIEGNVTQLENTNILNITANIDEENSEWSVEKNSVVNPGTLQDHQNTFRRIHKSDGTLENEVVKAANILLSGTGSLNGSNILKGGNTTSVENQQIAPSDSIAESIVKIASAIANHADKTGSNTHGATSSAIANKIMIRDANGCCEVEIPVTDKGVANKTFVESASTTGNAATATALQNTRTIDGMGFSGDANIAHFGTCDTAAATQEKAVAISGFSLAAGSRIAVLFTNGNTCGTCVGTDSNVIVEASAPTLNVNNTGAKPIYVGGEPAGEGFVNAGEVHEFIYDGTKWHDLDAVNIYAGDKTINNIHSVYQKCKDKRIIQTEIDLLTVRSEKFHTFNFIIPYKDTNYYANAINIFTGEVNYIHTPSIAEKNKFYVKIEKLYNVNIATNEPVNIRAEGY